MSAECRINVLEYLGAVLGLSVFMGVGWLYLLSLTGMLSLQFANYSFVPLVLAVALTVVVHEGTHAVVAKILGAKKIKAGISWYGAYVAVEDPLPRDKWVIVALAPLIISPITLLLAYLSGGIFRDTLIQASIINFVGSSGDIVLVLFSLTTSRDTLIRDEGPATVFRGKCPDISQAHKIRALAPAGLALFLMLTIVLPILMFAAQFSLPRADRAKEILQDKGTMTVDLFGLVEARASLVDTPSGKVISYTAEPKPLYFAMALLVSLIAGYIGWLAEKRRVREQK
ncbi:MAG: DUF3267 domain-containing protein [Thermofilum sp.]|nr:DUF3267 domain-containing protein [Thermofilum sp.]